jgi:hypothetical protein
MRVHVSRSTVCDQILSVNHLSLNEVFVHRDYSPIPNCRRLALWIQSVGNKTHRGSVCDIGAPDLPSVIACSRLTPLSVIFSLPPLYAARTFLIVASPRLQVAAAVGSERAESMGCGSRRRAGYCSGLYPSW